MALTKRESPDPLRLREVFRFLSYVREGENGCWIWTGKRSGGAGADYGYARYRGRMCMAHRASFEIFIGELPPGHELDHLCCNKLCVNPDHLEAVTHSVNIRRSYARLGHYNTRKTYCRHGHLLSGPNLYTYVGPNGRLHRGCRICNAAVARAYRARLRQPPAGRAPLGPVHDRLDLMP